MLKESGIYTIHIIGGNCKGMQNILTIIHKVSYLTTVYIDVSWYQNKNGHEKSIQDTKKSPQ